MIQPPWYFTLVISLRYFFSITDSPSLFRPGQQQLGSWKPGEQIRQAKLVCRTYKQYKPQPCKVKAIMFPRTKSSRIMPYPIFPFLPFLPFLTFAFVESGQVDRWQCAPHQASGQGQRGLRTWSKLPAYTSIHSSSVPCDHQASKGRTTISVMVTRLYLSTKHRVVRLGKSTFLSLDAGSPPNTA